AQSLIMTDTLPAGVTFVSATGDGWNCAHASGVVTCTRGSLAVGDAPQITITLTAPLANGTITNTATIASSTADPVANNNSDSEQTTVAPSTDLDILIADSTDPVEAGAVLAYTIDVNNAGPIAAPNVTVVDTLPAGTAFTSAVGMGWSCNHA